jgi:hypothetical protein
VSGGRPPRKREVTSAAAAVADALDWHGISDELRAQRVATEWSDIVGARIANRAWPDGLTTSGRGDAGARVLWIRVSSSAWLHELTLLKDKLAEMIRTYFGPPPVFDELRMHLGSRPKEVDEAGDLLAGVARRPGRATRKRPPPAPATGLRADQIEAETAVIEDKDLRELVRGVRTRNDR